MVSNRNFSIPIHILKELEKHIIDFVWAGRLSTMEKNCFTRVLSEEKIGSFEGDYFGPDFLKTNSKCHIIKSKDSFYVIKPKQKFNIEFIPSKYNHLVEEHIFGNP